MRKDVYVMNFDSYTQRSMEALQSAKRIGQEHNNPELVQELQSYEDCLATGGEWKDYRISMEKLTKFHDRLLAGYIAQMNGDGNNVLFKMKELWGFMGRSFPEQEKPIKKLVKAKNIEEYERLARRILEE